MEFTDKERAILAAAQGDLPDSATPFADIAHQVGAETDDVIALFQRLKDSGVIRRFGASIKHQRTGWTHNAMVAWKADRALADVAGPAAAEHTHISHCYYRPSAAEDWPYTLYTMIHGRDASEIDAVIGELRSATALDEYAVLESLKELKKISMTYF